MQTIGRHLIVELYQCDARTLDDVELVESHMLAAAARLGATIKGSSFHAFEPQGVSGAVVIAESHLSIHTWPRLGYVAIDIFTCGGLDPFPGFDYLAEALACGGRRVQEILRGIPEELAGQCIEPRDVVVESRWLAPGCQDRPPDPST